MRVITVIAYADHKTENDADVQSRERPISSTAAYITRSGMLMIEEQTSSTIRTDKEDLRVMTNVISAARQEFPCPEML
jgi:hypothetical protein